MTIADHLAAARRALEGAGIPPHEAALDAELLARSALGWDRAGLIARRIVPFVKEGDTLATGERFGLIRFGSRVDVYLPAHVVPLVGEGQTAIAGETVLADLSGNEPVPRSYRGI